MCDCTCGKPKLQVGDIVYGYCYGAFGYSSEDEKEVEAIGPRRDWVVLRGTYDRKRLFFHDNPDELVQFTTPPEQDGD